MPMTIIYFSLQVGHFRVKGISALGGVDGVGRSAIVCATHLRISPESPVWATARVKGLPPVGRSLGFLFTGGAEISLVSRGEIYASLGLLSLANVYG